jgi:pimeloyl-ACP methyl ester carboxylesterase
MTEFVERTFVSKDGLWLYYRDYPGPADATLTLLCLPGLTRNSRDFADFARHQSKRYRVLCADLRGRGKSAYSPDSSTYQPPTYVQDVARLLEHAGLNEVVFIGTSLGGLVSMMCANLIRTRVKAVILNDVGPMLEQSGLARVQQYVGKQTPTADWNAAAAAVKALNQHVYPAWSDNDWLVMAKRLYVEQPDGSVMADYDKNIAIPFNTRGPTAGADLWPVFIGLDGLPVLVLRGALSDILSAEGLQRMREAVPSIQTVEVPNVGHAPYLLEPEADAAISAFLAALPRDTSLMNRVKKRVSAIYHFGRMVIEYR